MSCLHPRPISTHLEFFLLLVAKSKFKEGLYSPSCMLSCDKLNFASCCRFAKQIHFKSFRNEAFKELLVCTSLEDLPPPLCSCSFLLLVYTSSFIILLKSWVYYITLTQFYTPNLWVLRFKMGPGARGRVDGSAAAARAELVLLGDSMSSNVLFYRNVKDLTIPTKATPTLSSKVSRCISSQL